MRSSREGTPVRGSSRREGCIRQSPERFITKQNTQAAETLAPSATTSKSAASSASIQVSIDVSIDPGWRKTSSLRVNGPVPTLVQVALVPGSITNAVQRSWRCRGLGNLSLSLLFHSVLAPCSTGISRERWSATDQSCLTGARSERLSSYLPFVSINQLLQLFGTVPKELRVW